MTHNIYKILCPAFFCLLVLAGCDAVEPADGSTGMPLTFTGRIMDASQTVTRAPNSYNISRDSFDTKFYMEKIVGSDRNCATYLVNLDRSGILANYQTEALKWSSPSLQHTFYSWTMPWILNYEKDSDPFVLEEIDGKDNENYLVDRTRISFVADDPMYAHVPENKNCAILETFIGAKAGPVSYNTNGEYVNMQFQHLVSKIYIETLRFTYIDADGSLKNRDVVGTMTLQGLPSEGFFIREGDKRPYIVPNEEASNEVTFDVKKGTTLYICPDVDFSNVKFRIKAQSGVTDNGDFIGDFKSVTFVRDENDWWDKDKDNHTLYAGEKMTISIYLRQGRGTLFSTSISPWDPQDVREGIVHSRQGIYSANEMQTFYETFRNGYSDAEEERMFKNYGYEDGDLREYRLYEDISNITHGFRFGRNYVLNGMGNTVNISRTYDNCQVRISKCKDIYITDNDGHKVYINEYFEIFTVAPDGTMTKTGQLPELNNPDGTPVTDRNGKPYNAYTLNLQTGTATLTTDV